MAAPCPAIGAEVLAVLTETSFSLWGYTVMAMENQRRTGYLVSEIVHIHMDYCDGDRKSTSSAL